MFGSRGRIVVCIACGERLDRSRAREYDKHGDRWTRGEKSFEYLCKPCFRGLDKQDREGLESVLEGVGAGEYATEEFVERYLAAVQEGARTDE